MSTIMFSSFFVLWYNSIFEQTFSFLWRFIHFVYWTSIFFLEYKFALSIIDGKSRYLTTCTCISNNLELYFSVSKLCLWIRIIHCVTRYRSHVRTIMLSKYCWVCVSRTFIGTGKIVGEVLQSRLNALMTIYATNAEKGLYIKKKLGWVRLLMFYSLCY